MIGQKLGHYRVDEKIGAGGMGEVYRARDEHLERDVAIKVLPAGTLADEGARKRFRKEALALSKLNHPNIATIFDFDTQDGVDFLVMEHITGAALSERLTAGPLAEKEIGRLGMQLAEGLAAAHAENIIHRDLKPANLRLTPDGRLKILDFGLAKLLRPAPDEAVTAESLSESHLGAAAGTLPYMAPEQLRGEAVDARADIYAAGCVLYELATGQRPFPQRQGAQLIEAVLGHAPRPPRELLPSLSGELERIVLKCLEKDPENRYQSAKELLVDLRRAVFTPTPLSPSPQAPPHGAIAVLPLDNLSRDPEQEYFSDGMTEALITELSRIRALKVISRTSVMQYKGVKKPLPQIARELKVDTVVEGSVLRAGARVRVNAQLIHAASDQHLWAESYEREVKDILSLHSELARAIAREVQVTLTPQEQAQLARARPVNPEAYEAYLKGDYYYDRRTEEAIRKSRDYFKQAIERDPTYALAYSGLANSANGLGWYSFVPPNQNLAQAKPAALKALEIDETLAEAHAALACIRFYAERDWANAETEFKRALELDPRYANTHHWYADYLSAMGRHAEGVAEARHARELEPLSLIINTWLGRRLYLARQYDEAITHLRQTVEMDPSFAPAHFHLGLAYEQEAMRTHAITELRTAARLSGSAPIYVAELANACARARQRREARKLLQDLKRLSKKEYVSPYQIAAIHVGLGEKEQGLAWLEKSYAQPALWLVYIKVDPQFDSLRGDPRFKDLLRRMNFPEK